MPTVSVRDLARNTTSVIQGVQSSRRPALVTRNGRPVVALIPIDEAALEDWILTQVPDLAAAGADLGRTAHPGGTSLPQHPRGSLHDV
ncbi:MAG: type II toxin-antitoxin system Phd/YefM family antitoxin [Candidatus Dormibacteria bacterium]|jgi:prevent-host-death family protein